MEVGGGGEWGMRGGGGVGRVYNPKSSALSFIRPTSLFTNFGSDRHVVLWRLVACTMI